VERIDNEGENQAVSGKIAGLLTVKPEETPINAEDKWIKHGDFSLEKRSYMPRKCGLSSGDVWCIHGI
jgi:hypothetical protein